MRALPCLAWSAVGVGLMAGGAHALPPPAYADAAVNPAAAPVDGLDRYGGRAPAADAASASPGAVRAGPRPFLTWSGKTEPPASAARAPESRQAASPVSVASAASPSPSLWRPPPAPATIYDPPRAAGTASVARAAAGPETRLPAPPSAAPRRQDDGGPRFYSVHRDYGIQPDAIPLAPQFFGPTADLSAPPADAPVKRVTSASGQTRTVDVASGEQTSQ